MYLLGKLINLSDCRLFFVCIVLCKCPIRQSVSVNKLLLQIYVNLMT